jgi:hypothetical protein
MNDVRRVMESVFFGIDESEGLTHRKPNDAFKNEETGEVIKFVKILDKITIEEYISFINSNAQDAASDPFSPKSLKTIIDGQYGKPIDIENIILIKPNYKPRPTDILMVAIFEDMKGVPRAYVKVGRGSGVSWKNQDFGKETKFVLQKIASTSEKLPIKMSDIFPMAGNSDKPSLTMPIEQFVNSIVSYTETAKIPPNVASGIKHLMTTLISDSSDQPIVIPNCAEQMSVFMKYVGEMVAPVCLYKNKHIIAADTSVAEIYADFGTEGKSFDPTSSQIKVYRAGNVRIVDSKLIDANGRQMGISSKAKGGGADASIDILYDTIKKMESDGMGNELLAMKEDKVIDIITAIRNNSSFAGPVVAAKILGIFEANGASDLYDLLAPLTATKNTRENIAKIEKVIDLKKYPFITNYNFKPKTTEGRYLKTYHAITVLARMVCDIMNSQHHVSDHIKKLLSRKALVQAYTNFTKSKNGDLIFNNIKVVYPAKLPRDIIMSSEKPYSASYINGKITFSITRS